MWHTILEVKNTYLGEEAIFVGTGPSADKVDEFVSSFTQKPVLMGANRAIVLRNDFNYLFIDRAENLRDIKKFLGRSKFFCVPLTSCGQCNLNYQIVQDYRERILLFAWVYEVEDVLVAPEYPLNDFLLYVSWGVAQTALSFARLAGIKKVYFIGCDGGPIAGQLNATAIEKTFGLCSRNIAKRKSMHYKQIKSGLEYIAQILEIEIDYPSNFTNYSS